MAEAVSIRPVMEMISSASRGVMSYARVWPAMTARSRNRRQRKIAQPMMVSTAV